MLSIAGVHQGLSQLPAARIHHGFVNRQRSRTTVARWPQYQAMRVGSSSSRTTLDALIRDEAPLKAKWYESSLLVGGVSEECGVSFERDPFGVEGRLAHAKEASQTFVPIGDDDLGDQAKPVMSARRNHSSPNLCLRHTGQLRSALGLPMCTRLRIRGCIGLAVRKITGSD